MKSNWKSTPLLAVISVVSSVFVCLGILQMTRLSFFGGAGIASWLVLFALTIAASRLTVSITNTESGQNNRKSLAEAFVFLAVIFYAAPPTSIVGPPLLLAAFVGFASTYGLGTRREMIVTIGMSVISTYVAASSYGILIDFFGGESLLPASSLPLSVVLVPLFALAILQYLLNTIGTTWFWSIDTGKFKLMPSSESVVWTLTTQLAAAASAALFYLAILHRDISYSLLGLLISALTHLLYRFNQHRVDEVRAAEAERRRHIEEMADIHMNTIESLAIAIDAKDQTTHGHVRRTQIYAREMGKLLSVNESDIQALHAGALLHDIGKLAVPEYILNKPGKLTEAEFAKMKIHPTVGGDILRRVNFPYPVEDIVRYHHEKWDGSGYPKGLKGEAIPLIARIISVVDFYDATRCDRPYRKGMKREESIALLRSMVGSAFDPRVVDKFVAHVEEFDQLIGLEDIQEQVPSETPAVDNETKTKPDAGLASDVLGTPDDSLSGFRFITEAQREVFALHEIAQTIGSSLNLNDTLTLVSNKLKSIVPFDSCIIFLVDERTGKASAAHAAGDEAELFSRRRMNVGDGITGWVIANSRSMCNASPDLDMVGVQDEIVKQYRCVLVSPLQREDGSFGAISLYSKSRTSYTTEHVRLLESVCQHASSALNNALTYEKTRESALIDPLTELPNARGFYMMLEQRIAESQRMNREPLVVISMDIDDFKIINDKYGHSIGDRLLASVAGTIRRELRQMDILTRYAGDEFVAIMPMASSTMAASVMDRIRNTVEEQLFSVRTGTMIGLGISAGYASFPEDGETTEELLTTAARNMQRDKHSRKTVLTIAGSHLEQIDMMT
ncbi:MAG TPA: HD domain-containing phosphohydrolase [Pyrinomonadaceae bacterium]|jgi:diguanylate cyclase (GGDEF)-like protein/putative nucleotidyltransferase with HDIG domain|nr:HD domain-containing phosphohydrolase [Pyrinomonadaceae bacterium]